MGELSKFDELRLKTDNDLLKLLNNDVELGLASAREALRCVDDSSSVVQSYLKGKRAHAEATRLLPLAYGIPVGERVSLQWRLDSLSRMLEALQSLHRRLHPCDEETVGFAA